MFSRGHSDAVKVAKIDRWDIWVAQLSFEVSISQLNAHIQDSAIQSNKFIPGLDKAPRPSISNVIRILSSDTICQLNHIFFQIVRRQCCLSPPSSPEDKVYFVFLKSHSMSLVPLYIIAHKSDTKWQQLRHRCDDGTSVKSTKRAKSAVKCHKDSAAARFFYLPWK